MEILVTSYGNDVFDISVDGLWFSCVMPEDAVNIAARLDKSDRVILEFQDAYGAILHSVNLGPGDTARGRALGRVFGGGK